MHRLLASFAVAALLALTAGCDDPIQTLQRAIDEGKKAAIAEARAQAASSKTGGGDFADDEAAKKAAGGISLGPGQAKRLYYQFIDARGRVAFVERLSDVPASWRDKVGFVEMESPPPLSPAMAERTRDQRYAASNGGQRAGGGPLLASRSVDSVVLYSADWCGWCQKAKRHLDGMGINYEIRDIDVPANLNDLVAKTGQKGIPVLDVGGRIVTGFAPDQYEELIRARRT